MKMRAQEMRVVSCYGSNITYKVLQKRTLKYFPKSELSWFLCLQFYVVQDLANRGSSELLSDFLGIIVLLGIIRYYTPPQKPLGASPTRRSDY